MYSFNYNPPPTLDKFHCSDKRVRVVRGPVGSAKTTAMIMELLRRAAEQPKQEDGIRRSRSVIVRNTMPQLKSTCLVSILQLLRPIARWKPSDSMIQIRAGDIEADWILLPLDTEQNVQRLLSLEVTNGWVSECREVDPEIVMNVLSRCGRYPSSALGGPAWYGVMAESNSFREDSPWYDLLENNLPANWEYFVQPGAMEQDAENRVNLPPSYYEDLLESNTEEWAEMYVHNKYGQSLDGQAVYKNSFNSEFHIAKSTLKPNQHLPIIIGMDFARWPAAVICQLDATGRLLVFEELEQENTGVEKFATERLFPVLRNRYNGIPCYLVGDPSGASRSQIGEESVFDALKRIGLASYPATTNLIPPRLRAVEKFLMQQREGKGALIIDPRCVLLIQGFKSKYRYRKKKSGDYDDKPDKKRPWADLHDALQYAALGTARSIYAKAVRRFNARTEKPAPPPPVEAWT